MTPIQGKRCWNSIRQLRECYPGVGWWPRFRGKGVETQHSQAPWQPWDVRVDDPDSGEKVLKHTKDSSIKMLCPRLMTPIQGKRCWNGITQHCAYVPRVDDPDSGEKVLKQRSPLSQCKLCLTLMTPIQGKRCWNVVNQSPDLCTGCQVDDPDSGEKVLKPVEKCSFVAASQCWWPRFRGKGVETYNLKGTTCPSIRWWPRFRGKGVETG